MNSEPETLCASLNRLIDAGHKPTPKTIEAVAKLGLSWNGIRFEVRT